MRFQHCFDPGESPIQQIEELIGPVARVARPQDGPHPAPGMHARHYSPRTRLLLVKDGHVPRKAQGAYLQLGFPPRHDVRKVVVMPDNAAGYAARLYEVLHALDADGYDWIAVDTPESGAEWEAVLDRLRRAAASET